MRHRMMSCKLDSGVIEGFDLMTLEISTYWGIVFCLALVRKVSADILSFVYQQLGATQERLRRS